MEELFTLASRNKYRFDTPKGSLMVEDLWDLPLTTKSNNRASLDNVAKQINREMKETMEESFVTENTPANSLLSSKLDILKYIIKTKQADIKFKEILAARKEKKEKILSIIADKEDDSLKNTSIDDLKKMLSEL